MGSQKNTREKIIDAAWQLFYDKGYEQTSVEDIIRLSGTSKGSFYHYFESKDSLMGSLSYLFDRRYDELESELDENGNRMDMLLYLNHQVFEMIENTIDMELLTRLYATQLMHTSGKELLDRNRSYYRLLRRITAEGQARGEITKEKSIAEIVNLYAMAERALLYDWCLRDGANSLVKYADEVMPMFLNGLRIAQKF